VVRPTSETIINAYFSKWIQSYRDLPFLINQWANVVRWELRPRLFLRTTEFLWQEGHTAHGTEPEAREFALGILRDVYEDFMVNVLAIPVLTGRKTERERFSGATTTWTCEAMMRDGKALQMGTSHELGQGFAKAFGISFLDEAGRQQFAWQTSWGASSRLMGALIMAHGDDAGLRVPPHLAPIQVVVLAVRTEDGAGEAAAGLAAALRAAGYRVELDLHTELSFGRRVVGWELKGVPVRVEIGPRDLAAGTVVLCRRDNNTKTPVPLEGAEKAVAEMLETSQAALLAEAHQRQKAHTLPATTLDDALEAAQSGFATVPGSTLSAGDGEARLNAAGVTVRLLRRPDGSLPATADDPDELEAVVARSY
jgi:prolyl-tRNA synthetase